MEPSRRCFLGAFGIPAAAALVPPLPRPSAELLEDLAQDPRGPEETARDEDFWERIQRAFPVDRSLINFNNGGVSPSPAVVQDALRRHLAFANQAPAWNMWRIQEPNKESIRQRLAATWGVDTEEVAIVRNASEGLQICQFGFDLKPGDEVLTTTQDYPRMITTFQQRERREGIRMVQIRIPVPAEDPAEVVRRFEEAITERTRLILCCHMINLTGQILPVREIAALGRRHGIPVIVDGAHALAHFDFRLSDLDCEYYASSLHKWLHAPFGTGLLYVRRERIPGLWPLMAAPETQDADIRKFEQFGTHPVPIFLAIAEALSLHQALGGARKEARLRYLRDRWARRLLSFSPRVRLHTSLDPRFSCGIANVEVEGLDPGELAKWLFREHRIIVTSIGHPECPGLRISPSIYSTVEEVDRFSEAMERAIRNLAPTAGARSGAER